MAKHQPPEQVAGRQLNTGDDVVIHHGRDEIAARIQVVTHGVTGPGGRNFVVLHCNACDGSEFTEVVFAEETITRTGTATLVAA